MDHSPARDVTGSTPAPATPAGAVPPDLAEALARHGDGLGDYCRMWLGDAPAAAVAGTVRAALLLARDRRPPSPGAGRTSADRYGRARLYAIARVRCLIRPTRPVPGAATLAGAPPRNREADAVDPARAGLRALDRRRREVLELAFRHGLDHAEIAAVTGLGGARVQTLLTEAQDVYEAWVNVVLLSRSARARCAEGAALAAAWTGRPGRGARTRLRVHVTGCATCSAPAGLTVDAGALLRAVPVTPLTDEQRALVLDLDAPPPGGVEWGADGFPVQPDRERPPAAPPVRAPVLSAGLEANRAIGFWADAPDVPVDDPDPTRPIPAAATAPFRAFPTGIRPPGTFGIASADAPLPAGDSPAGSGPAVVSSADRASAGGRPPGAFGVADASAADPPADLPSPAEASSGGAPSGGLSSGDGPAGGGLRSDDRPPIRFGHAFRSGDRYVPFAYPRPDAAGPRSRFARREDPPADHDGFAELGHRSAADPADDHYSQAGTFQARRPGRSGLDDDTAPDRDRSVRDDSVLGRRVRRRRVPGKALAVTTGVVVSGGLLWAVFGPVDRPATLDVANERPAGAGSAPAPTPLPDPSDSATSGVAPSASAPEALPLDPTGTAGPGTGPGGGPGGASGGGSGGTAGGVPADAGYGAPALPGGTPHGGGTPSPTATPGAGAGSVTEGSDSGGAGGGATAGTTRPPGTGATGSPGAKAAAPRPSRTAAATPGATRRGSPNTSPSGRAKPSPSGRPTAPSHRPPATPTRPAAPPVRLVVTEGAGGGRRSEIILLRAVNGTVAWRATVSTPLLRLSSTRGTVRPQARDGFRIRLTPLATLAAQGHRTIDHLYRNCGRTRTATVRIAWKGENRAGVAKQGVIPLRVTFQRPCP